MKKAVLMLAVGGVMLATPSCKKGENDPFMSLSSRKARLSGEWDVTSSSATWSSTSGDWTSTTTVTSDGTTETSVNSTTSGGTTTSSTDTRTINADSWIINKDGTYTREYNYTETDEDDNGFTTTVTTSTVTSSESGTWSFVGKTKGEFKNKERVIFNTLSSTESSTDVWSTTWNSDGSAVDDGTDSDSWTATYSHGEMVWAVNIDQLKGKEMIWTMEGDGTNSNSETSGGTTTTWSSTSTGSATWTLTHR